MNTSTPTSSAKGTRPYAMTSRAASTASTRDRIAREAAALFLADDYDDVTLTKIAKAAGVSHQTVLNHFESKEGVVGAAAEIIGTETSDRRTATPGDLDGAIAALVAEYERIGDANARWAATADRVPVLAPWIASGREHHQAWLHEVFGASLPDDRAARRDVILQLHVATDVMSWKLLRRDLGLTRAEVVHLMREQVAAILDHRPTPAAAGHPGRKDR